MFEQKCPVKRGYTVIQAAFILAAVVCFILGVKQLASASDLKISEYSSMDKLLYYNNMITSAVSLFIASAVSVVFAILAYVKKKEFEKNAEIGTKQLEELSEIKNSLQKLCKSVETEQQRRNEKDTWICKSCGEIIKLAKGESPTTCPKCKGTDFIHRKGVEIEQGYKWGTETWICKSCGEIIKLTIGETPASCPKCCGKDFIHR